MALKTAVGFETAVMERETWGPFMIPQGQEFTATDLGELAVGSHILENLMWWGHTREAPLELGIRPLTGDRVAATVKEMLVAQAVLSMPHVNWRMVMPIESSGRIITFDFDPQPPPQPVSRSQPVLQPNPKYADGDPPAPVLFMTGLDCEVTRWYHSAVEHFIVRGNAERIKQILPDVLGEAVSVLTQVEVFYFLFRVASLVTGAYEQDYSQPVQQVLDEHGRLIT